MKSAKERIDDAFLDRLREKPYDKIKVSELIRIAKVNRSTFYRCYSDVIALYTDLCERTVGEYISVLPAFQKEGDAFRFVESMYRRAIQPENVGLIRLLLGENGNGAAALIGRERLLEKVEREASALGLWDERMRMLVTFSADYMVIAAYYLLYAEKIGATVLPEIDFEFDYTADPIDTMTHILRTLYGGSSDVHSAMFFSTVRMFSRGDARTKPVTELLKYSSFSRTLFYRLYDDRSDYFAKLETGLNLLAVKAILPIMELEDVSEYRILLDLWDRYYLAVEQYALKIAFRDGYGFRLAANLISKLNEAYLASLARKTGTEPDEELARKISFFTCGVVCSLVYFYATLDRKAFFRRMELLCEIRKKLLPEK